MLIHLDRKSGSPLYAQIVNYVRQLIETDVLKPGVKLPATRELAVDLGVDRATIVAAYDELVGTGFGHRACGQGTFVAAHATGAEPRHQGHPRMLRASPGEINWHQCFSRAARINAEWRRRMFRRIVLKERRSLSPAACPTAHSSPSMPFAR